MPEAEPRKYELRRVAEMQHPPWQSSIRRLRRRRHMVIPSSRVKWMRAVAGSSTRRGFGVAALRKENARPQEPMQGPSGRSG